MAEIIGEMKEGTDLDVKRFYLPGIRVEDKCPKCKKKCITDLNDHYLSYPKGNTPEDCHMYCDCCDEEWNVKVIVRISLELVS